MPKFNIEDVLTPLQFQQCREIYEQERTSSNAASRICREVITPNLLKINRKLTQDNDAMFMAYAVCYVLNIEWQSCG